ncbi:activator of Hsp90 ATPase 1 family protein [Neobacillus bataviensis LMG 21833]|uniref:Activator of Hsp90 ATPase 1 family protein n=1 Tax=Neobacillus bataviensis LMG 21833 TaxID=1117379 RepID=K6EDT4_9BACI|nr:SRPBCC family protein [Neobacillus bataviensis]EKN71626.1 activator of Hsp90 ATPase 1 family protein [Neobacillus bataviensis LMG 21833]
MIASIIKVEQGYIAQFERQLNHSIEETWSWLTDNEKLVKWFPELQIGELREGGFLKFDMHNGNFEQLSITDLNVYSVLEFDWWADSIRFEITQGPEGCKLVLNERIEKITNHTPKDLAGWHLCLDVIKALMDGQTIEWREEEWKKWYEKYIQAMEGLS